MFKFLKGTSKSILGVDISSSSVKILEVSGNDSGHEVKCYAYERLPKDAIEGNTIKHPDTISDCIRAMVSKHNITTQNVALAVPDSSVISKVIQMNDGLSDSELEELVILEADKYIPYPIDEINIDFEVQGHSAKNSAMVDVLIVASRAENVSQRVDIINKAGLNARIVDVESFSVERTVELFSKDLPAEGEDKIVAVIDIGARYTNLFVFEGFKVIFSREEEFGGDQLLDGLAKHCGESIDEAMQRLKDNKLPEDYEEKVLQPFIDNILVQVKRTLQFFYSTSHHTYIDYLLLAGRVSRIPDLDKKLEDVVKVPCMVADPFKYMEINKKVNYEQIHNDAPALMICCGLALRHLE